MLGQGPQDEDLPPGDDSFDPNNFFYHGYGQFGNGPPPPPIPFDFELLHSMGWNAWPNQPVQGNQLNPADEVAPPLVPMQPENPLIQDAVAPVPVIAPAAPGVFLAIEEIIQAQGFQVEVELGNHEEEEVIIVDGLSEFDEEILIAPAPLVPPQVEVNIPHIQHPENFLVAEVLLEDLIPFDQLELQPHPQPQKHQDLNLQLGFVDTFIPLVDPREHLTFDSMGKDPSAVAVRCWAKHFSPIDRSKPTVSIPTEWMDFFSLLLLKPRSFEWAKEFLESPAWAAFSNFTKGNAYSFSLPSSSPSVIISYYSCSDPLSSPALIQIPWKRMSFRMSRNLRNLLLA